MTIASQPYRTSWLAPGQFRFIDLRPGPIGEGGLGRVYRIKITETNAPQFPVRSEWARKQLNERWSRHPVMRQRFEREIAALRCMSHGNIVTCDAENLPGGERFYIMPFFTSTLRKFIAGGRFRGNWRSVAQCGVVLAQALQYAHTFGFIHRDLKPDNILFNGGGQLVIADWGLGYFVHKESQVLQQLTRGGMGTEYYCSIEQWATGKCDGRGDIYSLGMTLDEWVTGSQRLITVGAGINGDATTDRTIGARRFNKLLRMMTHPIKTQRPGSMYIVAAELRAAAEDR